MMFLDRLVANCLMYDMKLALDFVGESAVANQGISYRHLEQHVLSTMAYLKAKGVEPGDRVAVQLPKCLSFIYLHLAVMRLGAISLPLNPGYPAHELLYFLQDAEAKLFFAAEAAREGVTELLGSLPALQETVFLDTQTAVAFETLLANHDPAVAATIPLPQDANATCLMIYTSGTTGRPKGAELTYGNLTANLNSLHEAWGWRDDDVILHVLPIFHVHGLIVALHGALNAGATAVLHPKFEAVKTLETLQNYPCTVFMAVPTIHRRLLALPNANKYDLSHMRLLTSGSDRLPDDVFKAYQDTFGHTLLERYGMSETGMLISNPLHGERRVGSVGLPLPGVEVRIMDPISGEKAADGEVGDVQVRGANVCKGYWRQPKKTAAAFTPDGWLRTGDLGLREPDGYFTLKGRSKDLVISGGFNIYPPEVELVLMEHPAVKDCAVVGCPDDEWGEQVTAVIISQPGHDISSQMIIDHCADKLIKYKVPRKVVFVDEFPANALGKIQKARLRQMLCDAA